MEERGESVVGDGEREVKREVKASEPRSFSERRARRGTTRLELNGEA